MNGPTHRRPKWTIGTMLIFVGWSSVVVWLNIRPNVACMSDPKEEGPIIAAVWYGCPWSYAAGFTVGTRTAQGQRIRLPSVCTIDSHLALAGNIAIGLLAVAVLTFASRYLLRRMVSGLRAVFGKPPINGKSSTEP